MYNAASLRAECSDRVDDVAVVPASGCHSLALGSIGAQNGDAKKHPPKSLIESVSALLKQADQIVVAEYRDRNERNGGHDLNEDVQGRANRIL